MGQFFWRYIITFEGAYCNTWVHKSLDLTTQFLKHTKWIPQLWNQLWLSQILYRLSFIRPKIQLMSRLGHIGAWRSWKWGVGSTENPILPFRLRESISLSHIFIHFSLSVSYRVTRSIPGNCAKKFHPLTRYSEDVVHSHCKLQNQRKTESSR